MFTLHAIDWLIIGLYVVLALGVGMAFKSRAGRNRTSYFLAGRALPWWWVGASMAATFAADTPLAVTGIIADKGLSGNWLWIPVIGVHAGVFVIFAANWSRSGVMTDAELIRVRYSGRTAYAPRWCRAGLRLLQNCVVLGGGDERRPVAAVRRSPGTVQRLATGRDSRGRGGFGVVVRRHDAAAESLAR